MSFSNYKNHYTAILQSIRAEGLFKEERKICSPQSSEILVEHSVEHLVEHLVEHSVEHSDDSSAAPKSKTVLNMCSNNYLGLSSHPEIIQAAHKGLDERGFGMSSVRFICGTQDVHCDLEKELSHFLGTEDTILFSSCFDANAALFETLLGPEDAVFSDKLVHASLIDGMRLCKAQRHIYEHSNLNQLEDLMKTHASARVKLIITDGVFSMDGDMAHLDEIALLAEKYGAILAVDDSHATGFIGPNGKGTHEHFNVMSKVDLITTTFGKALGGATGGCISGKKELIQLLKQRARPYLFSNALMPAVVYATRKALELAEKSGERRAHLKQLSLKWRTSLSQAGFQLKEGNNTPIVPVMLFDAVLAQKMSRALFEEGVFAIGFFYPVVPKGEARIRTQLSAAMTNEQLDFALEAFVRVGHRLGI